MNVDEVLNYDALKQLKENTKTKSNDSHYNEAAKKLRTNATSRPKSSSSTTSSSIDHLNERERLEILKLLENEPEGENFNEAQLKKLLYQLEKKMSKNQEMRIKFPDSPEKFMESELELNDIIQEMHVVSTRSDLYPILFNSNCIQQLLGLLNHENIDISAAIISLLQELTDIEDDLTNENLEHIKSLIDLLCEQQIFSLLVSNLERFDEKNKDEADGVHNALAIVENIIEVKPLISLDSTKQGFLQWLLRRIKVKGSFDTNKLYAAELLSIFVQNSDENRKLLGDLDGIDILLQQLAFYKKHDPSSGDEFEYMENLFNCLCSCLMLPANRIKFLKGEGLQLMRLILKEQKSARSSALKVLSYAMNNLDGKESCQAFVETLGLGVLFPLFMKPIKEHSKKKPSHSSNESHNNEEHIVSILSSLLKNCNGQNKQRVLLKFVENDYEKVDRLLELYFKYSEQVRKIDLEIAKERQENENDDEEDEEDQEEEYYMRRLENGLLALQVIAYIMIDISGNGPTGIKTRVMKLLNLRNVPKSKIVNVVKDYEANLGDSEDKSNNKVYQEEHERIKELLEKF